MENKDFQRFEGEYPYRAISPCGVRGILDLSFGGLTVSSETSTTTDEFPKSRTESKYSNRQICQASNCSNLGSAIKLMTNEASTDPILCETHAKEYLGVST